MSKLNDASLMPFGKHRNVPLEHVPADYLLWVLDSVAPDTPAKRDLLEYIVENKSRLELEIKEREER